MITAIKFGLMASSVAAAMLCPICEREVVAADADLGSPVQSGDTATVRLHISKMTCGTCAPAARLALKRVPGVYDAQVTYEDSLGVVRYDPQCVTPEQIAEQLTKRTGYPARILPDTPTSARSPRRR